MKSLLLIAILSIQSFTLLADVDFCNTPEAVLCNREENQVLNDRFEELKKSIASEAKINAAQRIETMEPKRGLLKNLRTEIAREKIMNQEIIYSAERHLGVFEKEIVSEGNVKLIKKYLTMAVRKSHLSKKYKKEFIKIINEKVIVGNYMDFMERTNVTSSYFKQLWRAHCGMDGMTVNAFATTADWKKYVLVCPGLLVKLNSLRNSQELTNEIFLILSHEIAHHFDSGKFKKAYESMAKCYQKEIGKELNTTRGSKCEKDDSSCRHTLAQKSQRTLTKCGKRNSPIERRGCLFLGKKWNNMIFKRCQKGTGESCYKKVTWKHLGEIAADYWAAKAMGLYMKDRNFQKEEGVEFLRVNFEVLCGSGDEGIHADGAMRGNYLLGQNPEIRNQLSCLPPTRNYCEI